MRTIVSCRNLRWDNAEQDAIACTLTFKELRGEYPFIAMSSDPETLGKQLFADLIGGKYGAIEAYVSPSVQKATRPSQGTRKV